MVFYSESIPGSMLQIGNGEADNVAPEQLSGARDDKIYFGVLLHNVNGDPLLVDIKSPTSGASFILEVGESMEIPIDNPLNLWLLSTGVVSAYSWRAM